MQRPAELSTDQSEGGPRHELDVRGMRVVVTGASGSLGTAVTEGLLALGASVVGVARRRTALEALRAAMGQHERLDVAECDLSDSAGVAALLAAVTRKAPLDCIVHCGGTFSYGHTWKLTPAQIERLVQGNLMSTLWLLHHGLPHLIERSDSSVVVCGAAAVDKPAAGLATYGAMKAALHHLVRGVAVELDDAPTRIVGIVIDALDTPDNRQAMPTATLTPLAHVVEAIVKSVSRHSQVTSGTLQSV